MKQRCHRLVARYGEAARVDPESLRHYFLEAGIKFKQPLRSLATSLSESQLRDRQVEFLHYLMNFIHYGTKIWYIDETSTSLWEQPRRCWQQKERFKIPKAAGSQHSVTLVGALTAGSLFSRLATSTNSDTIHDFISALHEKHGLNGTVLVMNNHTAHHSRQVKELAEDLGCHLLFLPLASSVLNPIELIWSHLKRKWRDELLKTPPERQTQQWMREQLTYIKEQFEESELRSLARGHYSDAIKVLQEAAEQAEQQPYQSWVRM